jgi:hypothetical protein
MHSINGDAQTAQTADNPECSVMIELQDQHRCKYIVDAHKTIRSIFRTGDLASQPLCSFGFRIFALIGRGKIIGIISGFLWPGIPKSKVVVDSSLSMS